MGSSSDNPKEYASLHLSRTWLWTCSSHRHSKSLKFRQSFWIIFHHKDSYGVARIRSQPSQWVSWNQAKNRPPPSLEKKIHDYAIEGKRKRRRKSESHSTSNPANPDLIKINGTIMIDDWIIMSIKCWGSLEKWVDWFAVCDIGIFSKFVLVEAAKSFITEPDESFDFCGAEGEFGNVVLRSSNHAMHHHVEHVWCVKAHNKAGSSL